MLQIDSARKRASHFKWALVDSKTMKATIFKNVPKKDISKRVASEFSDLIDLNALNEEQYSVVSYSGMKNSSTTILNSKTLSKALRKAALNSETIVVAAHEFTQEAYELLKQYKAIGFAKSEFYWTDESINSLRGQV